MKSSTITPHQIPWPPHKSQHNPMISTWNPSKTTISSPFPYIFPYISPWNHHEIILHFPIFQETARNSAVFSPPRSWRTCGTPRRTPSQCPSAAAVWWCTTPRCSRRWTAAAVGFWGHRGGQADLQI
jgi:hypothetical protein